MKKNIHEIGIIGCGWIVENAHIPAMLKVDNVRISGVFDIDIKRAKELSKKYDIKNAYDDIESFYGSGIDAVIIATPNFTHYDYSKGALERGIHVLCEKPVAVHAREVIELIDIAKKNNAFYIPAFVNRWREDIILVKKLIDSGKIGKVKKINAGWIRKNGVPRPGTWFTNKKLSGGGVLIDLGSHVIDICLMLLGEDNVEDLSMVTSLCKSTWENNGAAQWFKADYDSALETDVENAACSKIVFKDYVEMNVDLRWSAQVNGDVTYFNIEGSGGCIKLRTLFGFSNEKLFQDDLLVLEDQESGVQEIKLEGKENKTRVAFHQMAKYFVDYLDGKADPYTVSSDALKTVDLIENLYKVGKVDESSILKLDLEYLQNE